VFFERDETCSYLCEEHTAENEHSAIGERRPRGTVRYPFTNRHGALGFTIYRPLGDAADASKGTPARTRCSTCANRALATHSGWDFDPTTFEPVTLHDRAGRPRTFHFRSHIVGTGHHMRAFEIVDDEPGGHQFEVLDEFEVEAQALHDQLLEKIGRGLARKNLEHHELGPHIPVHRPIVGRIEWDEAAEDELGVKVPAVIIDGQRYSWLDFGHMWMTYEGFHFRLEMIDKTDEG